jgi:hypothetical protein
MPLRTFDEQRLFPYIAIADKSTRTLWVVPFSLNRAAIGDSTLISPVHIQILPGNLRGAETKLRFIVPAVPYHQPDFDTGMYTPEVRRLVDSESASFSERFARMRPVESVESVESARVTGANGAIESTSVDDPDVSDREVLYDDVLRTSRVIVLQDGIGPAVSGGPEESNEAERTERTERTERPEGPQSQWDGTTCLCRFGRTLVVSVPRDPTAVQFSAPSVYYAPVFADGAACGAVELCINCAAGATDPECPSQHV